MLTYNTIKRFDVKLNLICRTHSRMYANAMQKCAVGVVCSDQLRSCIIL